MQVQYLIVIVPTALPPLDNNPASTTSTLAFLVFSHGFQQLLQLIFIDLLSKLPASSEHYETVLNIGGAGLLHKSYTSYAIGGFRRQNLGQDRVAGLSCLDARDERL